MARISLALVVPVGFALVGCSQAHGDTSEVMPAKTSAKTVVIIGDSIAQGYGVKADEAFPAVAERWLRAKGRSVNVINSGVSGSLTAGADKRVAWSLARKPDVVLIELGGNDGLKGTDPAAIKENLIKAILAVKKGGAKPVLAGMKMFANLGPDYGRRFENVFSEVAREQKLVFMPFLLEGVATDRHFMQADGIHPNEAGHKIIGAAVGRLVEPLL